MSWAQTLVVVGELAAVVPQVERGLQRCADVLVAARVLGVMAGRAPVGIHVVHRVVLLVRCDLDVRAGLCTFLGPKDAPRRGRSDSWITRGVDLLLSGSRWWSWCPRRGGVSTWVS